VAGVGIRARVPPERFDELWQLHRRLEQPDCAGPAQEPLSARGHQGDELGFL